MIRKPREGAARGGPSAARRASRPTTHSAVSLHLPCFLPLVFLDTLPRGFSRTVQFRVQCVHDYQRTPLRRRRGARAAAAAAHAASFSRGAPGQRRHHRRRGALRQAGGRARGGVVVGDDPPGCRRSSSRRKLELLRSCRRRRRRVALASASASPEGAPSMNLHSAAPPSSWRATISSTTAPKRVEVGRTRSNCMWCHCSCGRRRW